MNNVKIECGVCGEKFDNKEGLRAHLIDHVHEATCMKVDAEDQLYDLSMTK